MKDNQQLPTLITIDDVARHLGVSVRHVRRLVFEKRIPYVKWGHLVRFDPAEISAWVDQKRLGGTVTVDRGFSPARAQSSERR